MPVRVLIVDDHVGFRTAAREVLEAGGFEVVGEAADGAAARRAAEALRPDVVLLDIQLPDADGFAVADRLEGLAVVLVSSRPGSDFGRRLASSSARGFIAKSELTAAAVETLLGG